MIISKAKVVLEDADHRAEVDGQVRSSLKSDFLLDAIVQAEDVQITED